MRFARAAAAALLAACAPLGLEPAGVPPPPPPPLVLREPIVPSATFGASLVARRRADGLRLEVLSAGRGRARGSVLSELKSADARLQPEIFYFAVRHPGEGILLFGAGFPEEVPSGRVPGAALSPFAAAAPRAAAALARRGIAPESVRHIVLPDISFERAGGAGAFPRASIIVSSRAWHAAGRGFRPDPRAFVPEERLAVEDISSRPPFGPFAHGRDLFGDGSVFLLDLEGGATGGLGLWINLDSGPVLLTGPAAFVYDNFRDQAMPERSMLADPAAFAWNARAMRLAREAVPRLLILAACDAADLSLSPRPDILIVR